MGYSLPAAIGAQIACPQRTVIAVMGDGAFQMSMNELATIRLLNLPIKIVVINNGSLGLVRELQRGAGLPEFAVDISGCPDFGKLAGAYGIPFARAADTRAAVVLAREAFNCGGPRFLECIVDPGERTS